MLQTGYTLDYTLGDVIHYKCKSGIYTTLVTDSPIFSKNYDVEFVACTDPDGKNYSIVKIGAQTWTAENLKVGVRINGSQNQTNNGIIEKYC